MSTKGLLPPEELDLLRSYDTPTICNVIELFRVRPRTAGYMDKRIQANFPEMSPMVGYACTATFRSAAPSHGTDIYDGMLRQLSILQKKSGPHVIVFQDLDNPPAAATFGEIMCTTYQTFGAVGLITSGTGRDIDQVRQIGFPVFTNGTASAHGYCQTLDVNVPVHVGGINIYPGDLLHGDVNGVTTIPHNIAGAVARNCKEYIAAEQLVLDCLRTNGSNLTKLESARIECRNRLTEMEKKFASK